MTGPIPGHDNDVPQPWGGRPPESAYGIGWDGRPPEPNYSDAGYQPPFPRPPRGPQRKMVVAIAAAVVVVVGAGVALWYYGVGPGRGNPQPVAATSRQQPPGRPVVHPTIPSTEPSATNPDAGAAYDVGSCFDEQQAGAPGKVELNPTPCGGPESVFVINSIVASTGDCEVGTDGADYRDHGYEVPDETANVAYCASLVVPVNVCFALGGSAPIARTVCGSGPNVVQVLSIESAPSANTACTDRTNPDVWFYQAPTSGQYACVSRPGTTTTTTAPTVTPTLTAPAG
jgi:hypothetical protein